MRFTSLEQPFFVHADRTRVKQVLINLLSNAIKYNRNGGSVIVTAGGSGEGRIRLSVTDSGTGLSAAQIEQLFQPFNRLGREHGTEEGTGIGLVVTKQLVELMGGTIGVESVLDVGTTFWIELAASQEPVLEPAALHEAELGVADGPAHKRTVLYVEDNPANLILVEQLVARRANLKLLTATDGYAGIELARAYQPDVILMDINLPGISGFACLQLLRDDPATAHIPVLALSANAMPRDVERGIDAGFFRYLTKPIKVPEFMESLDLALDSAGHTKATHD